MKKNQLGNSDLIVSEIGFGCMSLPSNEQKAISLIHRAIDEGITFFDTADLYSKGWNEEIVGKALKGKREKVILATKVGNHFTKGKDDWFWDPSKAYIKQAVKNSLRRLQTDYIDLYQLHGGTIDDPIDETIEAFEELKQEGIIREYGISSIRPNVIREYAKRSKIVSVMMQYSLLDRRLEEEMLSFLDNHHISVIARGPVAKGYLSNKAHEKIQKEGQYLSYNQEQLAEITDALHPFCHATRTLSQLAIRYTLHHPAVATVIPGASNEIQLIENIQTKHVSLTDEEIVKLQQITPMNKYHAHR
ncbi:aldo/keto reductase [Massilibacterium senegalense]|uniref:aldo/keto reductase n=1 Tax=Massilibacterium senegalense TaxID=1632858 RepID=UPI000782BB27|nr:aldo/keto reductase [Massilibacterium senegalense]